MATRLTALLADRELGLRLLSGRESTEVGWAHSSDLLDPTPFLLVRASLPDTPVMSFLEVPEDKAVEVVAVIGAPEALAA